MNKAALSDYRTHRTRWLEWCNSDEWHAISGQFSSMLWADAAFRLINETRKTVNKDTAAFTGLLAEALDNGFVAGQTIAIRKLVDKGSDTISLRRIADDIRNYRALITRENYVCHDGRPYDYEAVECDRFNALRARPSGTVSWSDASHEESRRAHDVFDELARVTPATRLRSDLIDESVFDALMREIDSCGAKSIVKAANKFLFHAADESSRRKIKSRSLELVLSQLSEVHRNLARVANFISGKLLFNGPCALGVPTAQFDVLERMDRPYIESGRYDDLNEWWSEYCTASGRLGYETLKL